MRTARRHHSPDDRPRVYCRYFDKLCLCYIGKDEADCAALMAYLIPIYAPQGARFFISHKFLPTETDWKNGVRPLLTRAYKRRLASQPQEHSDAR